MQVQTASVLFTVQSPRVQRVSNTDREPILVVIALLLFRLQVALAYRRLGRELRDESGSVGTEDCYVGIVTVTLA